MADTFDLASFCSRILACFQLHPLGSCKHYYLRALGALTLVVAAQLSNPSNTIVLIPSEATICVNAVTFDLLRSALAHQIRGMGYRHSRNSC